MFFSSAKAEANCILLNRPNCCINTFSNIQLVLIVPPTRSAYYVAIMLSSLSLLIVITGLVGRPHAKYLFIRPPPFAQDSYQDNPEYRLGKSVTVEWSGMPDDEDTFDLILYMQYPRPAFGKDISWTIKSKIFKPLYHIPLLEC